MKLAWRRIYLSSVIALFVVIAPVLLLYASGYRFDFNSQKIYQSGVLTVNSLPKRVQVLIDGKIRAKKTPAVIENIKPQTHQFRVEKDGFWAWEKQINIIPGQATVLNNITLVKKSSPWPIAQGEFFNSAQSPDRKYLALITKDDILKIINLSDATEKSFELLRNPDLTEGLNVSNFQSVTFTWSSNSRDLMVAFKNNLINQVFLLNLDGEEIVPLDSSLLADCQALLFYPQNSKKLFCATNNYGYIVNLENNSQELLVNERPLAPVNNGEQIFFLTNSNNQIMLWRASATDQPFSEQLGELPWSENYVLDSKNPDVLLAINSTTEQAYVLAAQIDGSYDLSELPYAAGGFFWSNDFSKLLVYNQFELWVYNLNNNQSELISRGSQVVKNAVLNFAASLAFYTQENALFAIEVEDHNGHYAFQLLDEKIQNLFIDPSGKIIYFLSQKNGQMVLYSFTAHEAGIFDIDL